jgi:hypothetical protein
MLFFFQPLNHREKEIFDVNEATLQKMIHKLDNNFYYLGGQLKLTYDDKVSMDLFNKVREINKQRELDYGGPCNSWEYNSILAHSQELQNTEDIVKKYLQIMEERNSAKLSSP